MDISEITEEEFIAQPAIARGLPNLASGDFRLTSEEDDRYNCIAWSLGHSDLWWWPGYGTFWPKGIERDPSVDGFAGMFKSAGYECVATDATYESGYRRIALYMKRSAMGVLKPTHAAFQVGASLWSSKLGESFDIEHVSLECLYGPDYGYDHLVFKGSST